MPIAPHEKNDVLIQIFRRIAHTLEKEAIHSTHRMKTKNKPSEGQEKRRCPSGREIGYRKIMVI